MNDKIVYRHRRLDTNEVFYVGMGSIKRAHEGVSSGKRSKEWKNIVNKHGYIVEVVMENITQEDAIELEELMIKEYGRKDKGLGLLVNYTDGGEGGGHGRMISDKQKEAISKSQKGIKKIQTQARIEAQKKKSEEMTGSKLPDWWSKKISTALKGRVFTDEWKENISKSRIGGDNPSAKKVINTETKQVWNSAAECADENKIHRNTLRRWLNGARKNNSNFKYLENGK